MKWPPALDVNLSRVDLGMTKANIGLAKVVTEVRGFLSISIN
ncbi:hypothetical protein [Vibrio sp. SCSIO 43136]|nr:hypothetical protein [Vibrio sp. SCSIO 43136]